MTVLKLEELSYVELKEEVEKRKIDSFVLPVGTVEPHGTHLPLGTDTLIPSALGEYVAEKVNAVLLPPVHYGVTTGLHGYFGSVRVQPETLEALVYEILESMSLHGFRYGLILNGHGGNTQALDNAAKKAWLRNKLAVMVVDWWILAREKGVTREVLGKEGGHAATDETAMVLAIRPELVKRNLYTPSAVYVYSAAVKAYPYPGTVINYSEGEGDVEFKPGEARRYFERVADLVADVFLRYKKSLEGTVF